MSDVIIRRLERGAVRLFEKGRFEVLEIGGVTVGRATYEPGWRWSTHVGAGMGEALCPIEHVGIVLAGRAAVSFPDRPTYELSAGDVFHIAAGHDSWVVGEEEYVSLHLLGADSYAK